MLLLRNFSEDFGRDFDRFLRAEALRPREFLLPGPDRPRDSLPASKTPGGAARIRKSFDSAVGSDALILVLDGM